jgi:hypothetical protein
VSAASPTPPAVQPAAADCRSCGRFIGPAPVCPYCGASAEGRLPLRLLRLAALVLAVGGLAALYAAARTRAAPQVRVADITPAMNFARVRVAGTVTRAPNVIRRCGRADYVAVTLDDGTGEITVAASRRIAQALDQAGLIPARHDGIDAGGTLLVSADRKPRLMLGSAGELNIRDRDAAAAPRAPAPDGP